MSGKQGKVSKTSSKKRKVTPKKKVDVIRENGDKVLGSKTVMSADGKPIEVETVIRKVDISKEAIKSTMDEIAKLDEDYEESKGVGDKLANVLAAPFIAPVTEAIKSLIWKDGEDCGCDERKENLNAFFKRRQKDVRCLVESDYLAIKDIVPNITAHVEYKDMHAVAKAHASVFNYHFNGVCSSCTAVNRGIIKDMKLILKEYES